MALNYDLSIPYYFRSPVYASEAIFEAEPSEPLFYAALLRFMNVKTRSPMFCGNV